jgi:hypothetical protein
VVFRPSLVNTLIARHGPAARFVADDGTVMVTPVSLVVVVLAVGRGATGQRDDDERDESSDGISLLPRVG